MLHRQAEIHERYMLHPRIVDVVAGLVGPDVLALRRCCSSRGPGAPVGAITSHANRSATRSRRAIVAHFCNARSFVPWDDDPLEAGQGANERHVLARGSTHLPHATPRFRAPVTA